MPIETAQFGPLLALLQLSDSALPIGRHAHAMGLERLMGDGRVETPAALREMIVSALLHGSARATASQRPSPTTRFEQATRRPCGTSMRTLTC